MDRPRQLALILKALEGMQEDISLMKVGSITCQSHGADVTPEIISRIEKRVAQLEIVAAALDPTN